MIRKLRQAFFLFLAIAFALSAVFVGITCVACVVTQQWWKAVIALAFTIVLMAATSWFMDLHDDC